MPSSNPNHTTRSSSSRVAKWSSGEYIGTFDPATGVDLTLSVSELGQSTTTAEMTLDEDDYTVTFADIEGDPVDGRDGAEPLDEIDHADSCSHRVTPWCD